jgi:Zn-dependent protease with chaperone function
MPSITGRPDSGPSGAANTSIVGPAIWAVALQMGFYILGIGTVCVLILIPLVQIHLDGKIGFSGFAAAWGAISLGWALIPPKGQSLMPGITMERAAAPELHRLVDEVAAELDMEPPDEISLLTEANAMVFQRRPGFHRVTRLALGLPLLHDLNVSRLRAVIAHELGHLHHGDLRLGPWVYGSRQAIIRSLERMDRDGIGLHLLFHWYGRLYLRISQVVSQRQEFHADQLAGLLCGRDAAVSALQRLEILGLYWQQYWVTDCIPVLEMGLRPPLLEGFDVFRNSEAVQRRMDLHLSQGTDSTDPYDSHPSLTDRCEALSALEPSAVPQDMGPAITLLQNPKETEAALIRDLAVGNRDFPTIAWSEAGNRVWLPFWRETIGPYRGILNELTPAGLADAVSDPDEWARRFRRTGPSVLSSEASRQRAVGLLGMWFAVTLSDFQWTLHFTPGSEFRFSRNGHDIEPFTVVDELRRGSLDASQWSERCRQCGL